MSRGTWIKLGVLLTVVIGAVVVQVAVGLPSQGDLRRVLDGFGPWAVPAFVGIYVGLCFLPTSPTAVLTIAGGAFFGFAVALPVVLLGAYLGAAVSFGAARLLGRGAVSGIDNERVRRLDADVHAHGLATVLVARLVPLVPFSTANYVFGLTSVTVRDYALATVVGIVPGTALYVALGAFGAKPGSAPFLLAVGGLVLLSVVGLLRRRRSHRDAHADPPTDDERPLDHG